MGTVTLGDGAGVGGSGFSGAGLDGRGLTTHGGGHWIGAGVGSGVCVAVGGGARWRGTGVGGCDDWLVRHWAKRFRRESMAASWVSIAFAGASEMAIERKLMACRRRSSYVTGGWWR